MIQYPWRRKLALSLEDRDLDRIQNIAVDVVAGLSTIGSAWIILNFILFKRLRTFRHQLILGLAVSDFFMCANFFASTAVDLSGSQLSTSGNEVFSNFNGFMTQLFVAQTDYWTFTIAVCTFLLLASTKRTSDWVQQQRGLLWCLPWGLSIITAGTGLAIVGYTYVGAWCWFADDRVNIYFNYIPRWTMSLIMLGLYWRLYHMIFRAHRQFKNINRGFMSEAGSNFTSRSNSIASRTTRKAELTALPPIERGILSSHRQRQQIPVLKKMAYQMLIYPTVYMIIWSVPSGIRLYQVITHQQAGFAFSTVDKACIAIQGFVNAILYGLNEATLSQWRALFASSSPSTATTTTKPITPPTPNIETNTQPNDHEMAQAVARQMTTHQAHLLPSPLPPLRVKTPNANEDEYILWRESRRVGR